MSIYVVTITPLILCQHSYLECFAIMKWTRVLYILYIFCCCLLIAHKTSVFNTVYTLYTEKCSLNRRDTLTNGRSLCAICVNMLQSMFYCAESNTLLFLSFLSYSTHCYCNGEDYPTRINDNNNNNKIHTTTHKQKRGNKIII